MKLKKSAKKEKPISKKLKLTKPIKKSPTKELSISKKPSITKKKSPTTKPIKQPISKPLTKQTSTKQSNKKITRVSTGIPNLDAIIEGGFKKNSTNLLTGTTGSGKSILSLQFLIQGIQKKEKCLYISFEESKETFYINAKKLGWDLEKLEKQGNFFYLEYTPKKVQTMIEEGGGIIESLVLRENISRIIVDSLASFVMLFKDDLKKREAALALFSLLKGWNCTTILTYEGKFQENNSASSVLEVESDSIIEIYFARTKNERKRFLEVLKMRGTNHSTKLHEFQITKGGIKLNKKPFAGNVELD